MTATALATASRNRSVKVVAPNTVAILNAWLPCKAAMGVVAVRTEGEHARALKTLEALLNEVGDDESHPLADVLDYLGDQVRAYEQAHIAILNATPREVLRFLIGQHGLKQGDLNNCAPQSRISEILAGKREISKAVVKQFAVRFGVPVAVFLG